MTISLQKPNGLASALHMLQSEHSDARDTDSAVRMLTPHIERLGRARGTAYEFDEIRQLALMKLMRTTGRFRSYSEAAARDYLAKVVRNVVRDFLRRERIRQARMVRVHHDELDPLELIAASEVEEDTWSTRDAIAEELLERLRDEIEFCIASSALPLAKRDLQWKQAQATLLARLGEGMSARRIAEHLGVPDASEACVNKWVERGRDRVLRALDTLKEGASTGELPLLDKLGNALEKRRKDAGKPRLARRTRSRRQR